LGGTRFATSQPGQHENGRLRFKHRGIKHRHGALQDKAKDFAPLPDGPRETSWFLYEVGMAEQAQPIDSEGKDRKKKRTPMIWG